MGVLIATSARMVLQDCEAALGDLRAGATGLVWRTRWVAVVTLLRMVGHVLDKVDGARAPRLRSAIDAAYQELKAKRPEPLIFWEFIDKERNNLLKTYEFGVQQNVILRPGGVWLNLRTGESGADPSGPTTYEDLVREGLFAGQDPRAVVAEAIEWWKDYLRDVEDRANH